MNNLKQIGLLFSSARSSRFVGNIARMLLGTIGGQLVAIAVIPLLTRVYSVESFGVLGLYVATANFTRVLFSLRYDFAIQSASTDGKAGAIFYLSICTSGFWAITVAILCVSLPSEWLGSFDGLKYLLPAALFISSLDNILSYWLTRQNLFKQYSFSRFLRASLIGIFQLVFGLTLPIMNGLIVGVLLGELIVVIYLLVTLANKKKLPCRKETPTLFVAARDEIDNPKYLLPGQLLNVGVAQLPIIAIAYFFGATFSGYWFMAQKVVSLPGQLVGNAIFRVFFEEARSTYQKEGNCYELTKKTVQYTFLLMGLMFIGIDIVLFNFIGILLGNDWLSALPTILIYSLVEIIPAVFLPISSLWVITNNQRQNLKYQISRSLMIAVGLGVGLLTGSYYITLLCFGVARSVSFSAFLRKCIDLSKGDLPESKDGLVIR